MIAEVTIDIDDAFNSLSCIEQAECVSNFYYLLDSNQQEQFISEIIEYADDDVLIGELELRGYKVKKKKIDL